MAHHEKRPAPAGLEEAAEGALGTPPTLPKMATEEDGGFDFWLFALLAGIAVLVAIQNLWLRKRAQAESDEAE